MRYVEQPSLIHYGITGIGLLWPTLCTRTQVVKISTMMAHPMSSIFLSEPHTSLTPFVHE